MAFQQQQWGSFVQPVFGGNVVDAAGVQYVVMPMDPSVGMIHHQQQQQNFAYQQAQTVEQEPPSLDSSVEIIEQPSFEEPGNEQQELEDVKTVVEDASTEEHKLGFEETVPEEAQPADSETEPGHYDSTAQTEEDQNRENVEPGLSEPGVDAHHVHVDDAHVQGQDGSLHEQQGTECLEEVKPATVDESTEEVHEGEEEAVGGVQSMEGALAVEIIPGAEQKEYPVELPECAEQGATPGEDLEPEGIPGIPEMETDAAEGEETEDGCRDEENDTKPELAVKMEEGQCVVGQRDGTLMPELGVEHPEEPSEADGRIEQQFEEMAEVDAEPEVKTTQENDALNHVDEDLPEVEQVKESTPEPNQIEVETTEPGHVKEATLELEEVEEPIPEAEEVKEPTLEPDQVKEDISESEEVKERTFLPVKEATIELDQVEVPSSEVEQVKEPDTNPEQVKEPTPEAEQVKEATPEPVRRRESIFGSLVSSFSSPTGSSSSSSWASPSKYEQVFGASDAAPATPGSSVPDSKPTFVSPAWGFGGRASPEAVPDPVVSDKAGSDASVGEEFGGATSSSSLGCLDEKKLQIPSPRNGDSDCFRATVVEDDVASVIVQQKMRAVFGLGKCDRL